MSFCSILFLLLLCVDCRQVCALRVRRNGSVRTEAVARRLLRHQQRARRRPPQAQAQAAQWKQLARGALGAGVGKHEPRLKTGRVLQVRVCAENKEKREFI